MNESAGVHVTVVISSSADPWLCHLARTCELKEEQVPDFNTDCDWEKIHMLYLSFASGKDSEGSHLDKLMRGNKAIEHKKPSDLWIIPHTVIGKGKNTSGTNAGTMPWMEIGFEWIQTIPLSFLSSKSPTIQSEMQWWKLTQNSYFYTLPIHYLITRKHLKVVNWAALAILVPCGSTSSSIFVRTHLFIANIIYILFNST